MKTRPLFTMLAAALLSVVVYPTAGVAGSGISPASPGTGTQKVAVVDAAGNQITSFGGPGSPVAADILAGRQTFAATTGAVTLITVPAGRVWVGTLAASVDCNSAAASTTACKATATFTTTGVGVTPAANNTWFVCQATSGANAGTGAVGSQGSNFCSMPFTAACASGTCTIAVASTQAGTASLVEACANGNLK